MPINIDFDNNQLILHQFLASEGVVGVTLSRIKYTKAFDDSNVPDDNGSQSKSCLYGL